MAWFADRQLRGRILAFALGTGLGLATSYTLRTFDRGRPPALPRSQTAVTPSSDAALPAQSGADGRHAPTHAAHLPRFPIDLAVARTIFVIDGEPQEFDPQVYFRHLPFLDLEIPFAEHPDGMCRLRTNSFGLREDGEPQLHKPDLRILVAGDSHTEGVCNNAESLAHVLGRGLSARHAQKSIESINAAKGGYSFYNYLGTLEKFLYLQPDVFIVAVYGPNDFEEVLAPYHYFQGTTSSRGAITFWPQVEKALAICGTWPSQEGMSLKDFQEHPAEIEQALHAAEEATLDIQDICKASGIALIYAYIPSRFEAEDPAFLRDETGSALAQQLYATLEIRPESLAVHDQLADALLDFLAAQQIPALDVRKLFRENKGPFYWKSDHHLDVNAQRLIGAALVPLVEGAGLPALR